MLQVHDDIAQLLLDVTHSCLLSCGGEAIAILCEDLHEVVCQVLANQVQTQGGMGEGVPFIDGHSVGTLSLESITMPVVGPAVFKDSTAWMAMYMAGC